MLFLQSHHQPFQYQTHTEEQEKKQKEGKEKENEEEEQEMREEEDHAKWFSRWEDQLPSPEELTPLTTSLITRDLALAFDITQNRSPPPPSSNPPPPPPPSSHPNSSEFVDSAELGSGAGSDEPARTLKRPRLVWTPQLHKRFVDAVAHLGIKNAVPKTIMQLMSVDGLTRENVASHLQKYRLYLKRMQGLSSGGGAGGGGISAADAAADHLFASAPVPHHFLHRGGGGGPPPAPAGGVGGEHFLPFVPVAALQHHHQQMAAAVAAAHQQQQFQRQLGHFGSPPGGQFDHGFLARQQPAMHRMVGAAMPVSAPTGPAYIEDLESGGGGRKVLTLFPTAED